MRMDRRWRQGTIGLVGSMLSILLLPKGAVIASSEPASLSSDLTLLAQAEMQPSPNSLFIAYPPPAHETVADRIFFIGAADPDQPVTINGQTIENRSKKGY
ncbi:MAG: hypothetical protein WBA76_21050, partial [Phormidesmis sp.]